MSPFAPLPSPILSLPCQFASVDCCFVCALLRGEIHSPKYSGYEWPVDSAVNYNIPLDPKFFSLETTKMPLTHHISISVQTLTPKLNPSPL